MMQIVELNTHTTLKAITFYLRIYLKQRLNNWRKYKNTISTAQLLQTIMHNSTTKKPAVHAGFFITIW